MHNIIIIGAPRSGTNMLRDVLTRLRGFGTWPCDEINYIWRHGNLRYSSDAIPAASATPAVNRYIQARFDALRERNNLEVVVEKTCANSLRVPFIDKVIPGARYLFIYRDGIDAAASAKLRWTASMDWGYLAAKARFVPLMDLPYYAWRFFWSRLYRLFSGEKRLAFWGPRLDNMDELLARHSLDEVCAIQWQECVEAADAALSCLPKERVFSIKYEEFVRQPAQHLQEILAWLGRDVSQEQISSAVESVSAKSIDKGRQALGQAAVRRLESLVGTTLKKLGYV